MIDPKEGKNSEIRINYGFGASSRHILDLKKQKKEEVPQKKKKAPFCFDDLLFYGMVKALVLSFLFFPKKIVVFLSRRGVRAEKRVETRPRRAPLFLSGKLFEAPVISFNFVPPERWSRALGAFATAAILVILPIKAFGSYGELEAQKNEIIGASFEAYEEIKMQNYSAASESFSSAKEAIEELGFAARGIISILPGIGDDFRYGQGLVSAGKYLSSAAASLDEAVNNFDSPDALTEKVRFLQKKIREAMPDILIGDTILSSLDEGGDLLPFSIRPFSGAIHDGIRALSVFDDFSEALLELLGDKEFKRYLFIFQNNNEIRPTGGFMGSFAIIDIDRGEIKNIEIPGGGTYDVQGQLTELVISPEPFHLINSAWQFQDANWFPDFPEAAKKIMWFYEKSGGPSVDGVVAVTASFMEDLLAVVGPVSMPEYDRIITAENFIDETQKIVEIEYDKEENKPKQFIADLAPRVLERLLDMKTKDLAVFSSAVKRAITEKDILLYVKNPDIERQIEDFGVSGKLKNIAGITDYLMLVDTNIAGQKTDGKIIKNISHSSEIGADGSVINTVKITRRHTGEKGALFSGVRNVNYLRLYVPEGSELLEATGFTAPPGHLFESPAEGYTPDSDLKRIEGVVFVEPKSGTRVNNEFGRTVFGNWIMVDPGQEAVVTLRYKLPQKIVFAESGGTFDDFWNFKKRFFNYKMFIEKQPGAKNTFFESTVRAYLGAPAAMVGEGASMTSGGWKYETALNGDRYYGVVLEK